MGPRRRPQLDPAEKDVPQFHPLYDPRAYLSPPPSLLTPEYQAIL